VDVAPEDVVAGLEGRNLVHGRGVGDRVASEVVVMACESGLVTPGAGGRAATR
jgi:hypothetical protein